MASTTFSYAQAAKGHSISQPSPQLTSSSAPASVKDDVPTGNTSVSAPSVTSNDAEARDSGKLAKPDAESTVPRHDLDLMSLATSAPSTASVEQESKTRREGESTATESQTRPEERGSRSVSRTSRANDNNDGKKGRKSRKPREKDTQSEKSQEEEKKDEAPKPVLSEAPPPAVNVWAQRIEAKQAIKTRPVTAPAIGSASSDNVLRKSQEAADTPVASANSPNGDQAPKKTTDSTQSTDQAPRRSAPRGSRANEKEEKSPATLPPVADVSFWPEPKAAATTEEVARKPQEKLEGGEKEGQEDGSGPKRKWKNLEINPTVVFNTPLPQRGGKPRTAARGGRDAVSTRTSHGNATNTNGSASTGERTAVVNGSNGSKAATSHPREGHPQSRTNTQPPPAIPHPTKRGSVDVGHKEQRKAPTSAGAEQGRESGAEVSASMSKRASALRDIRTDIGAANFEPGQALPRTSTQERGSHQHSKEGSHVNSHGQQFAPGERRTERGRHGGSFRARGGHSNGAGSHLPSAFPNGQYATHAPYPGRQNSAAPSPPPFAGHFQAPFPHAHRGRGNKWNPGQAPPRNGANGNGHAPKPSHGNDMAMSSFPGNYYIQPPQIDLIGLQTVIRTQVEYYLSVDNLCKDLFLRMQMDGQGFVRLSTVLGFKRMQDLVQDVNVVRQALSMSDTLDFGCGEDGIERLRLRDKWSKFVLPVSERVEAARNDGPAVFHPSPRPNLAVGPPYAGPVMHPAYHAGHPGGMYPAFSEEQITGYANGPHYDHGSNGADPNGHHHANGLETQLSAGVPEYAPHSLTLESMTNFNDDQVNNMIVVLGSTKKDPSGASDDASNEGQDSTAETAAASNNADGHASNGSVEADDSSKQDGRLYNEIKAKALEKRQNGQPGETPVLMRHLYNFWAEMLLRDFNSNVYLEFRDCAIQDAQKPVPAMSGMQSLLSFYEKLLHRTEGQKPWPKERAIPGIFMLHFQEAAELDRVARTKLDTSV